MTRNEYRWVAEIHFGIYSNAPEWLTMIQYVFSFLIIFALYNIIYFVTVYIYIYGTTIYIYRHTYYIYIYIYLSSFLAPCRAGSLHSTSPFLLGRGRFVSCKAAHLRIIFCGLHMAYNGMSYPGRFKYGR